MPEQRLPAEWLARANRFATAAALLSTTIHEVNNALQVISGNAELLQPDLPGDALVQRCDAIGGHARRGSALLAELSAYTRDDTPDQHVANVGQIAQRALALRRYTLRRSNIESGFESQATLPQAAGDPRAVLQIAINLLLNAESALIGRASPRILVSAAVRGDRVNLTVEDNGPGLSPEVEGRLFEPDPHRSPDKLGIGLAVSKWLAERDGGTLAHRPSALGGCAFTLSLRVEQ